MPFALHFSHFIFCCCCCCALVCHSFSCMQHTLSYAMNNESFAFCARHTPPKRWNSAHITLLLYLYKSVIRRCSSSCESLCVMVLVLAVGVRACIMISWIILSDLKRSLVYTILCQCRTDTDGVRHSHTQAHTHTHTRDVEKQQKEKASNQLNTLSAKNKENKSPKSTATTKTTFPSVEFEMLAGRRGRERRRRRTKLAKHSISRRQNEWWKIVVWVCVCHRVPEREWEREFVFIFFEMHVCVCVASDSKNRLTRTTTTLMG